LHYLIKVLPNPPSPDVITDKDYLELDYNGEGRIIFYISNHGGSAGETYLDVSVSENIDIIKCSPENKWAEFKIESLIWNYYDSEQPTFISKNLLYSMCETSFGSSVKAYSLTFKLKNSEDGWIKYRAAMNPAGMNTHNYNPDTYERYPTAGYIDQQGWFSNKIDIICTGINNDFSIPYEYKLNQNFPNPFNPETNIRFSLKDPSGVELKIFNLKGQLVKTLISEFYPAGSHQVKWDGTNELGLKVSSGVYIYRVKAGSFVETKRMVLIR